MLIKISHDFECTEDAFFDRPLARGPPSHS